MVEGGKTTWVEFQIFFEANSSIVNDAEYPGFSVLIVFSQKGITYWRENKYSDTLHIFLTYHAKRYLFLTILLPTETEKGEGETY